MCDRETNKERVKECVSKRKRGAGGRFAAFSVFLERNNARGERQGVDTERWDSSGQRQRQRHGGRGRVRARHAKTEREKSSKRQSQIQRDWESWRQSDRDNRPTDREEDRY